MATGRRLPLTALLLSAGLLAGCSQANYFVVVNESDGPVTVEYRFGPLESSQGTAAPAYKTTPPVLKPADALTDRDVRWEEPPAGAASVDAARGAVRVELPPKTALLVASTINYYEASWRSKVNVDSVRLTGPSGSILLEGDRVPRGFVEEDGGVYALRYR